MQLSQSLIIPPLYWNISSIIAAITFVKIVIEKIHALEFISRLIIHIPDENFKYIRFYGAYCNTTKCHKSFLKLFNEKVIEFKEKANKWRLKIITNFHIDPLSCPICNRAMIYLKSEYF